MSNKVMFFLALFIAGVFAMNQDGCVSAVQRAGSAVRFAAAAAGDACAAHLHL